MELIKTTKRRYVLFFPVELLVRFVGSRDFACSMGGAIHKDCEPAYQVSVSIIIHHSEMQAYGECSGEVWKRYAGAEVVFPLRCHLI